LKVLQVLVLFMVLALLAIVCSSALAKCASSGQTTIASAQFDGTTGFVAANVASLPADSRYLTSFSGDITASPSSAILVASVTTSSENVCKTADYSVLKKPLLRGHALNPASAEGYSVLQTDRLGLPGQGDNTAYPTCDTYNKSGNVSAGNNILIASSIAPSGAPSMTVTTIYG